MKNSARDISYAHSAKTRSGRTLIKTVENLSGRPRLIKMARGYHEEMKQGADFWAVMAQKYKLRVDLIGGSLDLIPKQGPLVFVANHPYGILDGLVMGNLLSQTRGDFRILANSVFEKTEELAKVILPISFGGDKDAVKLNLETRKRAISYLKQGGAIGIFPGGTVSTSSKIFGAAMDPKWRNFTAKLITKSNAKVVPIYFEGTNSRLFQIASHMSQTLRQSLLINEFRRAIKKPVRVAIGAPLDPAELARFAGHTDGFMDYLRETTYGLSPSGMRSVAYGHEFEANYR